MNEEEIKSIKLWQGLFKTLHPTVERELQLLPLAIFKDVSKVKIELTPNKLSVTLMPYKGLKGLVNFFRFRKKHQEWCERLVRYINFWLFFDKDGKKPNIEVLWEK